MAEARFEPEPIMGRLIDPAAAQAPPGFLRKLLRQPAAILSLICLFALTLAALIGPLVYPHGYDRVYRDFVLAPPSLTPHPSLGETITTVNDFSKRMHVPVVQSSIGKDAVTLGLSAATPIDQRVLRYFSQSEIFGQPRITAKSDDARQLTIAIPVNHLVFPFGTDANGRDLLARIFIALRISLAVGLLATLVALSLGVTFGGIAGFVGGRLDLAMMRFVEILYALPFIFFVILLTVFIGRNFVLIFIAIGVVEWLDMARIVRGETLAVKRRDYVAAAEALGAAPGAIFFRHVLPNMLAPIAAFLTLLVPRVIMAESFVSFLGLGVQEPLTSLGLLISDGANMIQSAPYLLIFPAVVLAVALAVLNILGDALTQAAEGRSQ
ncbi:MAG: ABC transporter permease [Methylovirgula sp.]